MMIKGVWLLLSLSVVVREECLAFSTVRRLRTNNPLLWKLEYERDEYNEALIIADWQKLQSPSFHRRVLKQDDISAQDVDESSALVSPEAIPKQQDEAPTFNRSSYQGLTESSKAALILAVALIAGMMVASSDQSSLSQYQIPNVFSSNVLHAYLDAGMFAVSRLASDAHTNWMEFAANFADFRDFCMLVVMTKAAQFQDLSQDLLQMSKEAMQEHKMNLAMLSNRIGEMETSLMQEAQVWNQAFMSHVETSKESTTAIVQSSWGSTSDYLHKVQTDAMIEADKWNLIITNHVDASRSTMAATIQNVQTDFAVMTDRLAQDFQADNVAIMDQVDSIQQDAITTMNNIQSDLSQVQASMTTLVQETEANLAVATDRAVVQGTDWMQTFQESASRMMTKAYSGMSILFQQKVQQSYHGFLD